MLARRVPYFPRSVHFFMFIKNFQPAQKQEPREHSPTLPDLRIGENFFFSSPKNIFLFSFLLLGKVYFIPKAPHPFLGLRVSVSPSSDIHNNPSKHKILPCFPMLPRTRFPQPKIMSPKNCLWCRKAEALEQL